MNRSTKKLKHHEAGYDYFEWTRGSLVAAPDAEVAAEAELAVLAAVSVFVLLRV